MNRAAPKLCVSLQDVAVVFAQASEILPHQLVDHLYLGANPPETPVMQGLK